MSKGKERLDKLTGRAADLTALLRARIETRIENQNAQLLESMERRAEAQLRLQQLVDESGGFGCFLLMAHNWARWEDTKRSYELIARYVVPHFQQLNVNRQASMDWVRSNKTEFTSQTRAAVGARIVSHMMEKGADKIRPEIVAMIQGAAPPAKE